jgi:hypothetical protein
MCAKRLLAKLHARHNIGAAQLRKICQNLTKGSTCSQPTDNLKNRNWQTANTRLAISNSRVISDVLPIIYGWHGFGR